MLLSQMTQISLIFHLTTKLDQILDFEFSIDVTELMRDRGVIELENHL